MLIFVILDIPSFSEPSFAVLLLLLHRKHARQHPVIEQGIWFSHVDYVQLYPHFFRQICHSEVKPLRVSLSIDIILQNQIILMLMHPEHRQQVT